ncbi:MAG TPA: ABC transporter permease [Terriglobia bacterium]|nr:ABC transporter permease [Terriglobia bacterium]
MPIDFRNLRENLLLALDTLRTHKFRSFLTILGVLIGTTTVIGVASIITGLNTQLVQAAEDYGTRTIFVYKFEAGIRFRLTREERMRKPLSYEDAVAIRNECPDVETVGVEMSRWGSPVITKYKGQEMYDAGLTGATADDFLVNGSAFAEGRPYTEVENTHRRNVAVIGANVVKMFFQNENPIGKNIVVDGNTFQIIGALQQRKQVLGDNGADRTIYIPYWTYRKIYTQNKENFILAMAYPGRMNPAMDEITGVLRRLRHVKPSQPNNFGLATADSIIREFHEITGTVALALIVLSSIGLLVGGIGVMNIMLVSVTERTREIGVRKAIGARRQDITWQFLLEAMTLTGTGGLLGILVGYLLSFVIRTLVPSLPSSVPLWSVFAGFLVSISIGLFFGMWPAMKASRLDPIVALRHE